MLAQDSFYGGPTTEENFPYNNCRYIFNQKGDETKENINKYILFNVKMRSQS